MELRHLLPYQRLHNCEIHLIEEESVLDKNVLVMMIYARDLSLCRGKEACLSSTANFVLSVSKECLEAKVQSSSLQIEYGYETETDFLQKTLELKLDVFGQIYSLELKDKVAVDHHLAHRSYCRPEL
jgi:hypothetical protein